MSKKFKRVTAYYPVEDYVEAELLLEVDSSINDEELKNLLRQVTWKTLERTVA